MELQCEAAVSRDWVSIIATDPGEKARLFRFILQILSESQNEQAFHPEQSGDGSPDQT